MKKQFLILFAFISVLALSQVPQRFNKVIVTGDITSPKFIKTGSTADSVLLGNGSARAISTVKTDTVSLSNRINAKATGNGTANGTNTGDETLTSIKTKLGAATSVSDGYLKYQDFALLHTPTTVTAANGLSISGQNISLQNASLSQSGALTFNDYNKFNSKEPAIIKNTGFNKNFGATTGTVLEGRTFGTAANSAVGDFIQNQNASAQPANMWIGGSIKSGGVASTHLTLKGGIPYIDFMGASDGLRISSGLYGTETGGNSGSDYKIYFYSDNGSYLGNPLIIKRSTGEATFESTVNSTGFLLNGNNLTSSLATNSIPKWNGSNFVNATAGTDYQLPITLTTNGTSGAATFENGVMNVPNYGASGGVNQAQTTVNGSISGSAVFSMPFQATNHKLVTIYPTSLNGDVTYTFPVSFPNRVVDLTKIVGSFTQITSTSSSVTISGATNVGGMIEICGY